MTTLRNLLITAVAVTAISAVASASTITIGYQTTIGPTATDITDSTATLTSWDPGDSDSTLSNVSGGSYTTGISMASLSTPGTSYTLTGFNISVKEILTGDYTITAGSSGAQGSVYIDTYTAVAIGGALSPGLSQSVDPTNDLYNCSTTQVGVASGSCTPANQGEQATSLGGGPDPNAPALTGLNLAANQTFNSGAINVNSAWVDYGCEVTNNAFNGCTEAAASGASGNELATGLGLVEGASGLGFDFSTLTTTDTQLTSGNVTTQYVTSVKEQVEVTYTFTESSTPEPTTMALMGGALLGLGLMRKRLKRS